jgi:hypothetical protein
MNFLGASTFVYHQSEKVSDFLQPMGKQEQTLANENLVRVMFANI